MKNEEDIESNAKIENHPLSIYGCDDIWTFSKKKNLHIFFM